MHGKLAVARGELGTDSMAKLMTATGASHSNVRTGLRSPSALIKLGRPTYFFSEKQNVFAMYMAARTKGGGLLTSELAAVLSRYYITDMGRERDAERQCRVGGRPGLSYADVFLGRHPQLRRGRPMRIEGAGADASTPEAVAQIFAAFRILYRDLSITRAAQVWNTDESMMNAQELMEATAATVVAGAETADREFVFPRLQSGA